MKIYINNPWKNYLIVGKQSQVLLVKEKHYHYSENTWTFIAPAFPLAAIFTKVAHQR
jgi:hypothetical protein